jgi:hypothetical protein
MTLEIQPPDLTAPAAPPPPDPPPAVEASPPAPGGPREERMSVIADAFPCPHPVAGFVIAAGGA